MGLERRASFGGVRLLLLKQRQQQRQQQRQHFHNCKTHNAHEQVAKPPETPSKIQSHGALMQRVKFSETKYSKSYIKLCLNNKILKAHTIYRPLITHGTR